MSGQCMFDPTDGESDVTNKNTIITVFAIAALASCAPGAAPANNVSDAVMIGRYGAGSVWKLCDEGRAIYLSKSGSSGGVAVVDNAAECLSK